MSVDGNAGADDGSAAEAALPESVAEHGDARATTLIVGGGYQTAHSRAHTERRKVAAADVHSAYIFCHATGREIELRVAPRECAVKDVLPVANGLPERIRIAGTRAAAE